MKTNILVTGPTGNTGLPVVQQLAVRKVPFRVLLHTVAKRSLVDAPGVDVAIGDFTDIPSVKRALDGIEKVYLLSPPSPDQAMRQKAFVDAAVKSGVKHIVKLSALGTASDSPVGLLRSHWEVEEYIRQTGVRYTFVQPHFFMENILANAQSISRDGVMYSPLGEGRINPVSVHDIAAAVVAILTGTVHEGKTYTLTGPAPVTYADIAAALTAELGRPVRYQVVPFEAAKQGMLGMGMSEWMVDNIITLMKTWAEGKGNVVSPDGEALTLRKPVSVETFVRAHRQAFARAA